MPSPVIAVNRDDSFALLVSLGVHALLLLLFFTVALESRAELEPPAPRMVELEFGLSPIQPVVTGPPQRAEAGQRAPARQQLEPERPAPPAATPVRPPERPRQTPPRETPPIPRAAQQPTATPTRPSPPSSRTTPEPNPTPRTQPEPTQGNGAGGGDNPADGSADTGTQRGSGGEAAVEMSFARGNRDWDCNRNSIPPAPQGGGSLTYVLTFNASGRLVNARATRRNTVLDNHIQRYLRCSAESLGGSGPNQTVSATFNVR